MQASAGSPWLKSVPDQRRYPRLIGSHDADVVVVGGGITGVMAAWYLAEKGAEVVLLEKNHIATGDTGFTTAFVTRVPDTAMPGLVKKHGLPYVQRLFEATLQAQRSLFTLSQRHDIDCGWQECVSYNCAYGRNDHFLKDEWEIVKQVDPRAEFIRPEKKHPANPSMVEAIVYSGEARFNVRKFIFGLLATSLGKKIKVFEESEVLGMQVGQSVTLTTEHGQVSAKKAIFATGLPPAFMSELHSLFTPQITYALSAKYRNEAPISDDVFWDTDEPYQYYRRNGDHTVILGGADHVPGSAQTAEQAQQTLERFLKKRLPGDFKIEQSWSGSLFYTEDGIPYAAAHPHYKDRVFVASGLGGNGMVMGAMIANICSDLALERTNRYADLFSFSRSSKQIAAPAPQEKITKPAPQPEPVKQNVALVRTMQIVLPIVLLAVLIFPAYFFFSQRGGIGFLAEADFKTTSILLFPLVGLYAFTLLWVQVMLGSSMVLFRKVYSWIEKFHHVEGVFVLLFALLHPSLLFLGYGPAGYFSYSFIIPEQKLFVYLGQVQLFLMMLTVATALLRKSRWLKKKWHYIHFLNYVVFISAWTHSWFLGSDVRTTGLRYVWIFFGLTFLLSAIARLVRGIRARSQWDVLKPAEGTATEKGTGTFKKVATADQLVSGKPLCVATEGRKLALFAQDNKYYALDNTCSHAGGPLCEGKLNGDTIQCPWHGSRFNIATGAAVSPPASRPVRSYKVRRVGNSIEVEL
jgi:glycine/D-amino acid oxidase-like deaminating enzyme/nitrite reductase/ring-hydroxylating ferredoxin subunit